MECSSMLLDQYFYLVSVDSQQAVPKGKLGVAIHDKLGLFRYLAKVSSSGTIGPWAGDRLITIGDDMKECPEGMLTKAEEEEINEWVSQQKEECQTYYDFVEKKYQIGRIADKDTITAPDDQIDHGQEIFDITVLKNMDPELWKDVTEQEAKNMAMSQGSPWSFFAQSHLVEIFK
ncbi:hypothetical protein JOM56_006651 [Amanita muscaria]